MPMDYLYTTKGNIMDEVTNPVAQELIGTDIDAVEFTPHMAAELSDNRGE